MSLQGGGQLETDELARGGLAWKPGSRSTFAGGNRLGHGRAVRRRPSSCAESVSMRITAARRSSLELKSASSAAGLSALAFAERPEKIELGRGCSFLLGHHRLNGGLRQLLQIVAHRIAPRSRNSQRAMRTSHSFLLSWRSTRSVSLSCVRSVSLGFTGSP